MKRNQLRVDKVRASRDGHEFHDAWAARRALQLVMPSDELVGIAVEGLAPADQVRASVETVEIADLVIGEMVREQFGILAVSDKGLPTDSSPLANPNQRCAKELIIAFEVKRGALIVQA